ncbi:MAG TPA: LUD domain-containing protein [Casimicrobiaceae bacterium]|nr:LUD domain-containing protein [Casimicrobiaceae bacterium]
MTSRAEILAAIRRNQPAPVALPSVPTFERAGDPPLDAFKAALLRMGGRLAEAPADGDLEGLVRRLFPDAKVVCSAAPEVRGNRALQGVRRPAALADVDLGVVRAAFGVAETGSVWLSEREFKVSSLGFLAQHLLVFLDPARIVPNMHHAYRDRARFDAGYGAFLTGPSATADIEGVLIHGAQGIRTLTVVPLPAR